MRITAKTTSLKSAFKEQTEKDTKSAYESDGYESAINVLNNGLLILPNEPLFLKLIEEYREYAPLYLNDLEIFSRNSRGLFDGSSAINTTARHDKYENEYKYGFSIDSGYVKFNINKKYTRFESVIACPSDFQYDSYRPSAKIIIYGDGKLLYNSEQSSVNTKPQNFSIDVSGIEMITFNWVSEGKNFWKDWGYLATMFDSAFYVK